MPQSQTTDQRSIFGIDLFWINLTLFQLFHIVKLFLKQRAHINKSVFSCKHEYAIISKGRLLQMTSKKIR